MEKLKTLKDINNYRLPEGLEFSDLLYSREVLKKEAIKHINYFEENEDISRIDGKQFCGCCFTNETKDWVMKFFNITEEDLK